MHPAQNVYPYIVRPHMVHLCPHESIAALIMDLTPEQVKRTRVSRRRFLQVSAGLAAGAGVIPRGHAAPAPDASGPEVILAQDGRPAAAIVIARNPTPNAKRAAAELQHYVARMSGAQLPIAADDGHPDGTLILVGESRLTREVSGVKIPSGRTRDLRDEGYVILVRPGMVLLAGNDTEPYFGTRYAVCDMLHGSLLINCGTGPLCARMDTGRQRLHPGE